jgi:hypothetical protein
VFYRSNISEKCATNALIRQKTAWSPLLIQRYVHYVESGFFNEVSQLREGVGPVLFVIVTKHMYSQYLVKPSQQTHRKKSFSIFPSPVGISLTKLSLGGNYDAIYKLFLPRESLVSDIPAGDGNIEKLF